MGSGSSKRGEATNGRVGLGRCSPPQKQFFLAPLVPWKQWDSQEWLGSAMCAALYVIWDTRDSGISSRLLMAKCRVAPLLRMTIPRGEIQSLTILTRLLLVAAEAFPERFSSISSFTDSMCMVGALNKMSTALKPYFGNCVSEIHHIRKQLAELTDSLPPVHHVPGDGNPADIGTRGSVVTHELSTNSLWQTGPSFLRQAFASWPTTAPDRRASARVPVEEVKKAAANVLATTLSDTPDGNSPDLAHTIYKAIHRNSALGRSLHALSLHSLHREKLELTVRVLARVLRAIVSGDRQVCLLSPPPQWIELAVLVLIRCSSASAREALKKGRLQGLGVKERGGAIWVQGRVRGEELSRLLGVSELPVILAS